MASALAGLGSGIDVNSLVSQLMAVEQKPMDALTRKQSAVQADISAYGQVRSVLASLQTAVQALSDPATQKAVTATSSDASALVSASAGTEAGTHALEITRLAQAHRLYSPALASASAAAGSGTLQDLDGWTSLRLGLGGPTPRGRGARP